MMRTVTQPQLWKDPSLLDPILDSSSWQTLMTVTRERERAREFSSLSKFFCGEQELFIYFSVLFF